MCRNGQNPPKGTDVNTTPTERVYAMIRVRAGLWLLPSNDGQTIWRLSSYEEHGDAQWQGEDGRWHEIKGTFWEVARMPMETMQKLVDDRFTDDDAILYSEEWSSYSSCLPTRKAAIEEALSAS